MPKPAILKQGERYTFSQYFEMPYAPEDILAELGCTLVRSRLSLPQLAEVPAGYTNTAGGLCCDGGFAQY
jgi:hypothetical protein